MNTQMYSMHSWAPFRMCPIALILEAMAFHVLQGIFLKKQTYKH